MSAEHGPFVTEPSVSLEELQVSCQEQLQFPSIKGEIAALCPWLFGSSAARGTEPNITNGRTEAKKETQNRTTVAPQIAVERWGASILCVTQQHQQWQYWNCLGNVLNRGVHLEVDNGHQLRRTAMKCLCCQPHMLSSMSYVLFLIDGYSDISYLSEGREMSRQLLLEVGWCESTAGGTNRHCLGWKWCCREDAGG